MANNPTEKRLTLRPYPNKHALPFCKLVHRRQPDRNGCMWSIAALEFGVVRGVAIVGRPTARKLDNGARLEVLRVAVEEKVSHACSMLYGACSRAARAMGATDLLTYTHLDESGVSLRAAGWIEFGLTSGGEHSRPSRPRKPVVDPLPKRRWFAPWSEMLKEAA
jgi:hypothetical protein